MVASVEKGDRRFSVDRRQEWRPSELSAMAFREEHSVTSIPASPGRVLRGQHERPIVNVARNRRQGMLGPEWTDVSTPASGRLAPRPLGIQAGPGQQVTGLDPGPRVVSLVRLKVCKFMWGHAAGRTQVGIDDDV